MDLTTSEFEQDTIVAIATAPGRGGIGVVRLSGPGARGITTQLVRLRSELVAGRMRFGELMDADTGATLDEVVVSYFQRPQSYTGEDVVEIAAHGSPVVLDAVLRACIAAGARMAEPGEFTQRAFLSRRMDLTQAEAVNDLIQASTLHQARVAARQLGGGLSRALGPTKQGLIELIATLEAGIDFAEDDIEVLASEDVLRQIDAAVAGIGRLVESFQMGRIVREGLRLAIVGRPNVGKSSLFNRLLGRERAIVTPVAGTTRDAITDVLSLDGIPLELTDTAGLREVPEGLEGEAERQGIARSGVALAEADVVLLVMEASTGFGAEEQEILRRTRGQRVLLAANKRDLAGVSWAHPGDVLGLPIVETSAVTGLGIDELRRAILDAATAGAGAYESALVTNARQQQVLMSANKALQAARDGVKCAMPHEMILLDLYQALEAMGQLTGVTTTEDILRLIFSSFCIGK